VLLVRRPDFTFVARHPIITAHYSPTGQPLVAASGASLFSPSPTMLTGTVKFYNDSKGFGFIVADDNQEEIFVHQTGLVHEIQDGDRVEFDIKEGKKGPNAVKVTRI
jgi:CspA family cold shock protein